MFFSSLTQWTPWNVMLRILISLVLGSLIGIDRGVKRRGAGSRTDAAVCLGATMVMLTAQYMNLQFPEKTDISRMASQVISGVGFLGAGSILVSRHQVKGLTSAAGVWICACIGLAEGKVYHYSRYMTLYVEVEDSKTVTYLLQKMKEDGCMIDMYNVERPKTAGQTFTILITACVEKKQKKEIYVQELSEIPGIMSVDSV